MQHFNTFNRRNRILEWHCPFTIRNDVRNSLQNHHSTHAKLLKESDCNTGFSFHVARADWIIGISHSNGKVLPQQWAQRTKVGVFEAYASTRNITCFRTPQLCMLSSSSHTSLSIPYPSIQWQSVWDLCALNNAVLKGQKGREGQCFGAVHIVVVVVGGVLELRLWEAAVNFQVSSNNEMHTVNVKQHPSTCNPAQLGNNEWLSLRPHPTLWNGENRPAVGLVLDTTCLFYL